MLIALLSAAEVLNLQQTPYPACGPAQLLGLTDRSLNGSLQATITAVGSLNRTSCSTLAFWLLSTLLMA